MSSVILIDKLMYWRAGNWVKYDQVITNAMLRVHCDQLIISADSKILECLNMNGKMKGFYKGDVLILVTSSSNSEIRKMKLRVKGNFENCLKILGRHFPVVCHGSMQNMNFNAKYRNVDEVVKCAMEAIGKSHGDDSIQMLPESYKNFVKLCLLDPTFPQLVRETQNILDQF